MLHRRGVSRAEPVTATVLRAPQLHGDVFLIHRLRGHRRRGRAGFWRGWALLRLHRGAAAVVMADGGGGGGSARPRRRLHDTASKLIFHRHGETDHAHIVSDAPRVPVDAHRRLGWAHNLAVACDSPVRPPGSRDSGPPAAAPARPATGRAPPAPDRAREGNSQRSQRLGRQPHSIPRVTARVRNLASTDAVACQPSGHAERTNDSDAPSTAAGWPRHSADTAAELTRRRNRW